MKRSSADVLVVGGSMVGATLALGLARRGFAVVLLDARPLNASSPDASSQAASSQVARSLAQTGTAADPIDKRTTAMSAATATILDGLGLWQGLLESACPIKSIHVSQRGHFGTVRLQAEDYAVPALGYVVDNQLYNQCVSGQLAAAGVQVYAPASISGFTQDDHTARLVFDFENEQHEIAARLLAATDGTNSRIRSLSGIDCQETDYQQTALVTSVETEQPHQNRAWERFTPGGPLAILPMAERLVSVICAMDADAAERSNQQSHEALLQSLQAGFGHRLGKFIRCAEPQYFPLSLVRAVQPCKGRVLLLGNALRTLHPVAGQGFNLAMRDTGKLLELLAVNALDTDPGSEQLLAGFVRARRQDQAVTLAATDFLARTFRGGSPMFAHLRGVGLAGLNAVPPLKRAFARRAMGFTTALPDLDYPRL